MRKNLFQPMVDHLETMIASGQCAPGSKIPALRTLCDQFQISTGTASRGIQHLVEKGILEVRHGSGTYVRARGKCVSRHSAEFRIALFMVGNDLAEHYCAHALRGVQDASLGHNCLLQTRFLELQQLTAEHLRLASEESDLLLFLGDYDTYFQDFPRLRPSVGLEMHTSIGQINSTITIDPVDSAEMAVHFFLERRCRKVRIITHPGQVHQMRSAQFALQWSHYGAVETMCFDAYDTVAYKKVNLNDTDCGYFFVSGQTCNHVARRFRDEIGGIFAAERHVLSIDGKSRLIPGFEPMNTVGLDWYQAGKATFEECFRRLSNPGSPARRIYIPGRFFAWDHQEPSRRVRKD